MSMNLSFIRYFLTVAETASFTTAADRCHVTQPTLSAGIARLEQEIGARLFDRGRRAALTAAGHRLLPHARAMVEAWQLARAESRSTHRARLLRVAIASTLPVPAALDWLASAQQQAGFEAEVSEGTAATVADRWRRGRCDAALFPARGPLDAPNAVALWREPYVLAAAAEHRVATRDRWSLKELADTVFVLRAACEAQDDALRLFAAEGVRPRAVLSSPDEERCAAAVAAGLGVSLMPRSLLRPGLVTAEIREVALDRRVFLAWRADADNELVQTLRDTALAHPWPGQRSGNARLAFAR
ncbi:LysR family transcriptional regulator [Reyranella massiliensis]|uniref:LysR family transcriptional regulator n=1 Tax=Reyranella massiliensis TaxID=445220 RepID=UPI0002ED03A9|nr:LysR family transcriptional regulator [Reyranella massiliensis]